VRALYQFGEANSFVFLSSLGYIVGVVGEAGRDILLEFVEVFFYLITVCLFIIVIGDMVLLAFECEPCDMV